MKSVDVIDVVENVVVQKSKLRIVTKTEVYCILSLCSYCLVPYFVTYYSTFNSYIPPYSLLQSCRSSPEMKIYLYIINIF